MPQDEEGRMLPVEGSEPEGPGFGKPWVPRAGVTFVVGSCHVRSAIDVMRSEGIVCVDLDGKWNHGAHDILSLIMAVEQADELGAYLREAAKAAPADLERWKVERRDR